MSCFYKYAKTYRKAKKMKLGNIIILKTKRNNPNRFNHR